MLKLHLKTAVLLKLFMSNLSLKSKKKWKNVRALKVLVFHGCAHERKFSKLLKIPGVYKFLTRNSPPWKCCVLHSFSTLQWSSCTLKHAVRPHISGKTKQIKNGSGCEIMPLTIVHVSLPTAQQHSLKRQMFL